MPHKIKRVMGEFKKGTLRSSTGKKVTDSKQAKAIGMSEDRRSHGEDYKKPPRKGKK